MQKSRKGAFPAAGSVRPSLVCPPAARERKKKNRRKEERKEEEEALGENDKHKEASFVPFPSFVVVVLVLEP